MRINEFDRLGQITSKPASAFARSPSCEKAVLGLAMRGILLDDALKSV